MNFERDTASVRKGGCVAATTSIAQRPSEVVANGVRDGPTGAADATHETFAQLDELLATLP